MTYLVIAARVIAAGSLLGFVIASLVIRLSNPDMTEMRVFLNYWHVWLGGAVAAIVLGLTFGAES